MTKPEVVDWLLKNGFKSRGFGRYYRHYFRNENRYGFREEVWEWITIRKDSVWISDTGEKDTFYECPLEGVHIGYEGYLWLPGIWELEPWEEETEND